MLRKLTINLPSRLLASLAVKQAERSVKRAIKLASPRVKNAVGALIVAEANRTPHGKRYEAELARDGVLTEDGTAVVVKLKEPLLRAIEYGSAGFDMKPFFLAKGKPGKSGGVYADVPIMHDAATLPRGFRAKLAKVSRVRMVTPGRSFRKTIQTTDGTHRMRVKHKRGIRDDMIRSGTSGLTIRRISSKSAPSSWWHPGFRGERIFVKVAKTARTTSRALLLDALKDVGIMVKR